MAESVKPENLEDPPSAGAHPAAAADSMTRRNMRTGLIVMGVVLLMVGVAFASVPLYRMFCRVTGFGGTTQVAKELPKQILGRKITIRFNADTARGMPWAFRPEIPGVTIRLGERGLVSFRAFNPTDQIISGSALYNVTPAKAGKYFNKIQCFCFQEQVLQAHQSADLPVLFYVDPKMNDDPDMRDVNTITLSYTFFKSDSKALEDAAEASYNGAAP